MATIFDNINQKLDEELQNFLPFTYRTDFCVGFFRLSGWGVIAPFIEQYQGGEDQNCRLLIGMNEGFEYHRLNKANALPMDLGTAKQIKMKAIDAFVQQLQSETANNHKEKVLQKLITQIKKQQVQIKLHLRFALHAKLYLLYNEPTKNKTPEFAYLGSSNLTLSGLQRQGELNTDVVDSAAVQTLKKWFQDRWEDQYSFDISQDLVEVIEQSWAGTVPKLPYHIFLKMVYHLSKDARQGMSEFRLPKYFKNQLLDFQVSAVQLTAKLIQKRNGAILGDVVGLGKTITASAIAKIFEEDFGYRTLILCPKNLKKMWETYIEKYELNAKAISISKADKELEHLRTYKLVIIDESHNLRSRESKKYGHIFRYLQENQSKVLLLSATPYNKSFLDLANQLRLFIHEDQDLGIMPEEYIKKLGGIQKFREKHPEIDERTIRAFEESEETADWREVMRMFVVRRTRGFIKEHYTETDPQKQRKYLVFKDKTRAYLPERLAKKLEYDFDPHDQTDQYAKLYAEDVVESVSTLYLPRYGLAAYLKPILTTAITAQEQQTLNDLKRAGKRLIGFCRTNLFKRLESSGYSFLYSIARHVLRNYVYLYAIQNDLPLPIGALKGSEVLDSYLEREDGELEKLLNIADPEQEEEYAETNESIPSHKPQDYENQAEQIYNELRQQDKKRKKALYKWLNPQVFRKELEKHLEADCKALLEIIDKGKNWSTQKDRQLQALFSLCTQTHPEEKILIFTQYADTAEYLHRYFQEKGMDGISKVTGQTEEPTEIAWRFSPESNGTEAKKIAEKKGEIRILISTDVLSEGQNLQDAHIIINYDLPWTLIRLIQRAGRVDRIGQKADTIFCYSMLPENGIEKIIALRSKLDRRLKENAEVLSSDEVFFEGNPVIIHDLYTEKAQILDEQDEEIDLTSFAFQIWEHETKNKPELAQKIAKLPNQLHATKKAKHPEDAQSVIVYYQISEDSDMIVWLDANRNPLSTAPSRILEVARCNPTEKGLVHSEKHHELAQTQFEELLRRLNKTKDGIQLGRKGSVKERLYRKIDAYYAQNKGNLGLFMDEQELKSTISDLAKFPMREAARDTAQRQLKLGGITDQELAQWIVEMWREGKLVIYDDPFHNLLEPKVICSMGLE